MIKWLFLAVALAPFAREALRRPMNAAARKDAPGAFADLPMGRVHYRWSGPQDGKVLVLIHGLTTPDFVFDGLRPALEQAGYRVLGYDHFGRGYSDRPYGAQDAAFFNRELSDLLQDQGVTGKITILGYSMGGAIAAGFGATHPQRVARTILIAPAGMGHDLGLMATITRRVPLLGDWLMQVMFPRLHRKGVAQERDLPTSVPDVYDLQLRELEYRGFLRSVLSSLRWVLAQDLNRAHKVLARSGIPVLAIWGQEDTVIPISRREVLKSWNPQAVHVTIEGAGHGLTYTHTDAVAQAITQNGPA